LTGLAPKEYAGLAMLFNVSGLIQDGIGATREHEVRGALATEGRPSERVSGKVELLRTKAGILVRAHIDIVTAESCARCLRPIEETLPLDFEEEFQSTFDLRTGAPLAEQPADDAFLIDPQHMLDLTEAIRQYREAAADMQPLCRPDCRGLCPRCGRDLNSGDCGCESGAIDARWQGLAAFAGAAEDVASKGKG
jgi:uncharacterized protein